ncbi:MAG: AsmA-like C-terminal domain-containing protein [Thermodesulfobacteriota bacterium]
MKRYHKRNRRLLLFTLMAIVTGAVVLLSLFPIDLTRHSSFLTSRIEERINGGAHIEGFFLKVLPLPVITIERLTMYDDNDVVIEAPRATIVISPLSLLKGEVLLREVVFQSPHIILRRLEDGSLNLLRFLKHPIPPDKVRVIDGNVLFSDGAVDGTPSYEMGAITITLSNKREERLFSVAGTIFPDTTFDLSGRVQGTGAAAELTGGGEIKGIETALLTPYLKPYLNGVRLDAKADLSTDFTFLKGAVDLKGRIAYQSLKAAIPSLFTRPLSSQSGSAQIAVVRKDDVTDIAVSHVKVLFGAFTINGGGSFQLGTGRDRVALHIEDIRIPLAALEEQLSHTLLPARLKGLKDDVTFTGGEVVINDLTLSGALDEMTESALYKRAGSLNANLTLNNAAFRHRRLPYTATGLSGSLAMENGAITLHSLQGSYGGSAIKELNGVMGDGAYTVNLKAAVDGAELTHTLKTVLRDRIPPSIEKIEATGTATIDLVLKGREGWDKLPSYSGKVILHEAGILHDDFPIPLHSLTGTVAFDRDTLTLTGIEGGLGKGSVALDGKIADYRGKKLRPSLDFSGLLTEDVVEASFKERLPNDFSIKEGIPFSGKATARKGETIIDAHLDSTAASINLYPFIAKGKGVPFTADLHLASKDTGLAIKRADVKMGRSSMALKGVLQKGGGSYSLSLISKNLRFNDLDRLSPYLEDEFDSSGALSLDLQLEQKSRKKGIRIRGEARIEGGSFSTPFLLRNISRFDGVVRFDGATAKGRIDSFMLGSSSFSGEVDLSSISDRTMAFNLTSSYLDLDDFEGKESRGATQESSFFSTITGSGTVTVKKGQFFFLKVSACDAEVALTGDRLRFSPVSCTISDGLVSGEVEYLTANLPDLFSLSLTLNNVELASFLRDLGVERRIITGKVSGPLQLSGRRWVTPLRKGFNGTAALSSREGKLWRFLVINKIFSIVNIISIDELLRDGLPYKLLSGDLVLKDGIVTSENIFFNSDSMRLSALGSIDLVNSTIDSTLGMHPFVTIDKIITNIPIAGWIIGGDEKSTVKMYYEIKGPLKKPDIKPIPVKSLGKSVFGILQRLLETPVRIVDPIVQPFIKEKKKEEDAPPPQP